MNICHLVFEHIARCQCLSCNSGFALCKMDHQDPAVILEPSIWGYSAEEGGATGCVLPLPASWFWGLCSWKLAARLYAWGEMQLLLPCPAVGEPWSCADFLWGQRLRLPAGTPLNNNGGVGFSQQGANFMCCRSQGSCQMALCWL